MARRIGLAQAMINDPAFLILDEPTSGLDPLGCKEVKDLILALKKRGKTVVITSHLLSDIEDVCDRVIILYGGKVRATGCLNDLLTVTDENRIVTPALPPAAMEKVLAILRENLHGEDFTVDHPRRSLEEFFLDVIARAKSDSVETAGVVGGGRIADYLTQGDEKSAILEQLVQEVAPPPPPPEAVVEVAAEPARPTVQEVSRTLEALTEEPKAAPAAVEEPVAEKKAEQENKKLEEANAKLNDLLGNRK